MTASQMKRIRTKLAQAAALTAEAHDLAVKGGGYVAGYHSLREITARAADDMSQCIRNLEAMDIRDRQNAEAIARQLREEAGMSEEEKQQYRRTQMESVTSARARHVAGALIEDGDEDD
jgi:hypothetical protein